MNIHLIASDINEDLFQYYYYLQLNKTLIHHQICHFGFKLYSLPINTTLIHHQICHLGFMLHLNSYISRPAELLLYIIFIINKPGAKATLQLRIVCLLQKEFHGHLSHFLAEARRSSISRLLQLLPGQHRAASVISWISTFSLSLFV